MSVSAILAFRFVTAEPARLVSFYTGLGFTAGAPEPIAADELALFGLMGGGVRLPLRLGDQRLDLDRFEVPGADYPEGIDGNDTRFQHIALVTNDAVGFWKRAESLGATPISRSRPEPLPASAGGVIAVKFRDPEGHPLELLQFPDGATDWVGHGLLGIDHSAIAVANGTLSRVFYEAWSIATTAPTLNRGPTQAALDGIDGAEVDVIPMCPRVATPHLELLSYRAPAPRSMTHPAVNDVAATRIVWAARENALHRDPDGHLHHFVAAG